MDDIEIKKSVAKRTAAKGVFTRHSNSLTRLMLSPRKPEDEGYLEVLSKFKTAHQRFEELHQETVDMMSMKGLEADDLEEQAVEVDSLYTEQLSRIKKWTVPPELAKSHSQPPQDSGDEDGEGKWQRQVAELTANHQKETGDLRGRLTQLTQELERTKLLSSMCNRTASTPLRGRNMGGLSSLPSVAEEGDAARPGNVFGDIDERAVGGSSGGRFPGWGRGRARGRGVERSLFADRTVGGAMAPSGDFSTAVLQHQILEQSAYQHQSLMASIHAPTVKLDQFDGNPLKYTSFIQAFSELFENTMYSDRSKLMALLTHCEGKAKKVVEACIHLDAAEGLRMALKNLRLKFGSSFLIRQAWLDRILSYPSLTTAEGLEGFAYDLECCRHTLTTLGEVAELECTNTLRMLVAKLSPPLRLRWRKIHRKHVEEPDGTSPLNLLLGLVKEAADDATDPAFGENVISRVKSTYAGSVNPGTRPVRTTVGGMKKASVNAVNLGAESEEERDLSQDFEEAEIYALSRSPTACSVCGSAAHATFRCFKYRNFTPEEKLAFVRKKRLCHLCLSEGHLVLKCTLPWKCQQKECGLKHHTSLHKAFQEASATATRGRDIVTKGGVHAVEGQAEEDTVELNINESIFLTVSSPCLPLTPVVLKNGDRSVVSYALLDSGSTLTLCTESVRKRLELKSLGKKRINVNTVTSKSVCQGDIVKMEISPEGEDKTFPVFRALSIETLPISLDHLARGSSLTQWTHLKDVDIPLGTADKVEILIGQNNAHLLEQFEKVTGSLYEPYAVLTRLGWTVFGNLSVGDLEEDASTYTTFEGTIPGALCEDMARYWEGDGFAKSEGERLHAEEKEGYFLGEDIPSLAELFGSKPVAETPREPHLEREYVTPSLVGLFHEEPLSGDIETPHGEESLMVESMDDQPPRLMDWGEPEVHNYQCDWSGVSFQDDVWSGDESVLEEGVFAATRGERIPDELPESLLRFWKIEEVPEASALSAEERKVLELWDREYKIVDGHVQLPIPFKEERSYLYDNYTMALRSLKSLGRRLLKNPVELKKYQTGMQKNFDMKYAEPVPDDDVEVPGRVFYLLHHGVDHDRKPDVTRIVTNGSAKYLGISLNSVTYKGPDLMNSLMAVLTRFRQYEHASAADIEGMFNQVKVPPPERNVQRFLYWEDGDPKKKVIVCRWTGHIFGTGWAPSAANYALKRVARDAENEVGPKVVQSVDKEFYVDDWLNSEAEEKESVAMVKDVRAVVRRGHFNLGKVTSNSRKVLASVEAKDRAKELAKIDLSADILPRGVMLGQLWDPEKDEFGFDRRPAPKPVTRRGMMSTVASLYDPLGLIVPYILPAKLLMRQVCQSGASWDEELTEDVAAQWSRWLIDLPNVDKFRVARWLGCTKTTRNTLHNFGDACLLAYGAVCYLVIQEVGDPQKKALLVSAKSKLAPSKYQTIPRLELAAATLAVKLDLAMKAYFSIPLEVSQFYSDSDIVLKMLLHDPADFDPFVRNRVAFIQEHSTTKQWYHIAGKENPADLASRGCPISELVSSDLWRFGPEVLRREDAICIGHLDLGELPEDFCEFSKKKAVFMVEEEREPGCPVGEKVLSSEDNSGINSVVEKTLACPPGGFAVEEDSSMEERKQQDDLRKRKREVEQECSPVAKRTRGAIQEREERNRKRKDQSERPAEKRVCRERALEVQRKDKRKADKLDCVEARDTKKARTEEPTRKSRKTVECERKMEKESMVKLRPLLERYSSVKKTIRAVAWLLRARRGLRTLQWRVGPLSVSELREAERAVVLVTQKIYLTPDQIGCRSSQKLMPRVENDLWVVGGRLEYADLATEIKHPVLVPEGSPLALQLVLEAHEKVGHCGVDRTTMEIRAGYWLVRGRREAKRVIGSCVICRRFKGTVGEQIMAPLPAHRLATGKPPFYNAGVDLFGPMLVAVKRSSVKRWGVLFTCFTCRAIHLEVAEDLSTSAFLCALERFVARRGKPAQIQSDNGTNLTGARAKLLGDPKIQKQLADESIEWQLNTPAASHQGGVWERMVRSVKAILVILLANETVTDDKLYTTLCMVESIVNNRPLTRLTEEVDADEPLTPAHLLHLRSTKPLFPQDFTAERLKRDWTQAQKMCDMFWQRWMGSYLPSLQKRTKWTLRRKNIEQGELVLVVQDNLPRGRWPLALVKEVHPGPDGVVRNLTLKMAQGELRRPIQKIVRLEGDG